MSGYVKCNPGCKFFRCGKRALIIKPVRAFSNGAELLLKQREMYGDTPPLILYCRWANDICIGYKCNYASCVKGAILPNGLCGLTARQQRRKKPKSIEIELLREEEAELEKMSSMLKRKGYEYIE